MSAGVRILLKSLRRGQWNQDTTGVLKSPLFPGVVLRLSPEAVILTPEDPVWTLFTAKEARLLRDAYHDGLLYVLALSAKGWGK